MNIIPNSIVKVIVAIVVVFVVSVIAGIGIATGLEISSRIGIVNHVGISVSNDSQKITSLDAASVEDSEVAALDFAEVDLEVNLDVLVHTVSNESSVLRPVDNNSSLVETLPSLPDSVESFRQLVVVPGSVLSNSSVLNSVDQSYLNPVMVLGDVSDHSSAARDVPDSTSLVSGLMDLVVVRRSVSC